MEPDKIKVLRREKLGLTQRQLAQFFGINPQTVARWEHGRTTPTEHQQKLLKIFSRSRMKREKVAASFEKSGPINTMVSLIYLSNVGCIFPEGRV